MPCHAKGKMEIIPGENISKICVKWAQILTPFLRNSHYAYFDTLKEYINADSRWLDLGCGHQILPIDSPRIMADIADMTKDCKMICGIDSDIHQLLKHQTIENRILGDISRLPFHDNVFNLITASMVVEHIKDPFTALREIKRVLKPGGIFILHTVNLLSYFGVLSKIIPRRLKLKLIERRDGKIEDNFPTYYKMNSPFTIKKLAKRFNFEVCELKLIETSVTTHGIGTILNFIELIMIRILRLKVLKLFRTNIISVFRKEELPHT
jgi:SAM-dependent methyltransferase